MTDGSRPTDPPPASPPPASARGVRVPVADLGPGETRIFDYDEGGWEQTGFVLNHAGRLYVYANRCPHVPYSLDFGDGQLMSLDRRAIMCSAHGARFDPVSGRCFAGPPVGRSLSPLPFERDGDAIVVAVRPRV